jgi:hypothetical protein
MSNWQNVPAPFDANEQKIVKLFKKVFFFKNEAGAYPRAGHPKGVRLGKAPALLTN